MKQRGLLRRRLHCTVCGDLIALYGNRRLTDGVLCRDCAGLLSPWTAGRSLSIAEVKEHLSYREENRRMAERFSVTRSFGLTNRVLIDDALECFVAAGSEKWREENTDVLPLSCVKSCTVERKENKKELTYRNKDGKKVSYVPKKYAFFYDYILTIRVERPGFDTVTLRLNGKSVDSKSRRVCDAFSALGKEICSALMEQKNRPPEPMGPREEFEDLLLSFEGLTEEDNGRRRVY